MAMRERQGGRERERQTERERVPATESYREKERERWELKLVDYNRGKQSRRKAISILFYFFPSLVFTTVVG